MKHRKLFTKIFDFIGGLFLSGLMTLLPFALTIGLFSFIFRLVKSWLAPIHDLEPAWLQAIPHSELMVTLTLIFVTGAFLRYFLLHTFIHALEDLVFKNIPILRQIYFGIKQMVKAYNVQDTNTFQQVVLLEFPRSGLYSIGFVTNIVTPSLSPNTAQGYYSIFIPTTPNPTTGFYIIAAMNECTILTITRQEAMALIISGGLIQPETLKAQKSPQL